MTPTRIILACVLFGLLVYDTWAMMVHGYEWTISKDLKTLAEHYPIVAVGIGIVLGHLFWAHPREK